ncbi:glutamic acid-rich protein-like isoform X2 [Centropristis striata]|uniref:glutamic acid-rich protein-like isoform X2 n=1 Tax=Centropristis striata TaxID=184440 RepID=UPI0027E0622C|nr:glutamic acid-rich protein-like isoform X2 [Centropristis striata]
MSKVQTVRALVEQRLTAAAEEIFGLFERTIAEYEEQLCRSKEKNERQQKLLDAVFNPQPNLHRADVQQLLVVKEEFPSEQQERSCSLDEDQEDPEPPHIKEEQEEPWTSQQGEQLQGLEEADITKFTFTPVPVKSEEDEEKPQSSQLHQTQTEQMETEADGEDCGGPEPDRNSDPDPQVQTVRALVEQRLTAAAEEIFGPFARRIAECKEELRRSEEKNERQQKLLDAVFNPQIQLHRAGTAHYLPASIG